jgi:hypothetical protein
MKKLFVSFLFLFLIAFAGSTIAKDLPGDIAGAKADYLYKKLKLTNEQYTSVYKLYLDMHQKVEMIALNKMTDEMKKKQMFDLRDKTNVEIEKLLTKEQKEKWATVKEKVCKVKYKKPVKKVVKPEIKEEKKEEKTEVKK